VGVGGTPRLPSIVGTPETVDIGSSVLRNPREWPRELFCAVMRTAPSPGIRRDAFHVPKAFPCTLGPRALPRRRNARAPNRASRADGTQTRCAFFEAAKTPRPEPSGTPIHRLETEIRRRRFADVKTRWSRPVTAVFPTWVAGLEVEGRPRGLGSKHYAALCAFLDRMRTSRARNHPQNTKKLDVV